MSRTIRVGIDVGGTFTDLYLFEEGSGTVVRHKLPSTPEDPHQAPVRGLVELLRKAGARPAEVGFVGLGTTVATNALLERKGAPTGLITTKGFRDLLEIGRQKRPSVYDPFARRPDPLVRRELRLEVEERIGADGTVIRALDEEGVARALAALLAASVESVAICFLNAYVEPDHERRAAAIARARWPGGHVSVSHEILPEFREYERLNSTVVNAYLAPRMQRYLAEFADEVAGLGIPEPPFVMNSGGGVVSPALAGRRPIDCLLSGPSGGVSGATFLAGMVGLKDIVAFDMGGTSTDVCLVRDGRPEVTHARMVDGLPVRLTALDIHTVGAGGSSVAWIDAGGLLRVGPRSVGAKPGPACYGTGGEEATVTDANVVLGRLNPKHLLGGSLPIDAGRAFAAIERNIARRKGLDVREAAAAILAVSNTSVAQAIRFVSVERGLDPAGFELVAFGGAGPLHAAAVARELGMSVLVPESPGVLCAMGVLTKDIQIDLGRTRLLRASAANAPGEVDALFAGLEREARSAFATGGLAGDGLEVGRTVDARYAGQNYELSAPVPPGARGAGALAAVKAAFHAEHRRLYGYDRPEAEVELVTFRLKATLPVKNPDVGRRRDRRRAGGPAPVGRRRVFFEEAGGFVDCPVYERADLAVGDALAGPAVVEQMDATTVLPPDFRAEVDTLLNLRLTRSGPAAAPAVGAAEARA
ncbi:MAG: hydantoinase/oxoprolinase family protein [Proteobacteria bacterium]|nr:hydantoinase/oxoprolinase family protein [Pseudomonadota bacterium]